MNLLQRPTGAVDVRLQHAASYCGVGRKDIVRMIDAGKLTVKRLGDAEFVSRAELDLLLRDGAFLAPRP